MRGDSQFKTGIQIRVEAGEFIFMGPPFGAAMLWQLPTSTSSILATFSPGDICMRTRSLVISATLISALSLFMLSSATYGQELKKGMLVGVHTWSVKLAPGVTMEQFINFTNTKFIPTQQKNLPGWSFYPVKWIRGEKSDQFGVVIIVPEKERDKYYNPDGSDTELGKVSRKKLQPIMDEAAKLGTMTDKYIDWLIY
jgi:hypothetical protein